jgi:predicted nucleic acid-binding protein
MAKDAEHVRQLLLRGSRAVVPELWRLEMVNGFLSSERRGVLTASDVAKSLESLDIIIAQAVDPSADNVSMRGLLGIAREFRLTAYDAVYLQTALRHQLPLATLDRQRLAAASKVGVEIVS